MWGSWPRELIPQLPGKCKSVNETGLKTEQMAEGFNWSMGSLK